MLADFPQSFGRISPRIALGQRRADQSKSNDKDDRKNKKRQRAAHTNRLPISTWLVVEQGLKPLGSGLNTAPME